MALARQLADLLFAGLVAGSVTLTLSTVVDPNTASLVGVILATMYYFSRYPWGARDGERYNDRIDALYDEYLPF
jgi:hypothetical protein